jgi:hypothetical protein
MDVIHMTLGCGKAGYHYCILQGVFGFGYKMLETQILKIYVLLSLLYCSCKVVVVDQKYATP